MRVRRAEPGDARGIARVHVDAWRTTYRIRSVASWRRAHQAYFARECARIGRAPQDTMPVVCRRFRLVRALRRPSFADTGDPGP